ncbi:glutaredoxin family protein [Nesterenkonia halophila]|uniref:Glutaredoxin family protein n=1 Tax=Nesterenkonia halobia TaxID=37922 RepID=A0ABP6RB50_9MICC|nr:glutaredoxin family protein [Nesterenkonia halophila]
MPDPDAGPLVEVLTRPGCHLCEEALAVAGEVCAEFALTVREVDISADEELAARHAEEVPVLRIDGAVRDFWRIDPRRMRRLLAEATGRG